MQFTLLNSGTLAMMFSLFGLTHSTCQSNLNRVSARFGVWRTQEYLPRSAQFYLYNNSNSTATMATAETIRKCLPPSMTYFNSNRSRRVNSGLPKWGLDRILAQLDEISALLLASIILPYAPDWSCGYTIYRNQFCSSMTNVPTLHFKILSASFFHGDPALADPKLLRNYLFFVVTQATDFNSRAYIKFAKIGDPLFKQTDRILLLFYFPVFLLIVTVDTSTIWHMLKKSHSRTLAIHMAIVLSDVLVYICTVATAFPLLATLAFGHYLCMYRSPQFHLMASTYICGNAVELTLTLKNTWLAIFALDRWSAVWRPVWYRLTASNVRHCIMLLICSAIFNAVIGTFGIANLAYVGWKWAKSYGFFLATRVAYFVYCGLVFATELLLSIAVIGKLFHYHRVYKHELQQGKRNIAESQFSPCLLLIGTTLFNSVVTLPHMAISVVDFLAENSQFGNKNLEVSLSMEVFQTLLLVITIFGGFIFHSCNVIGFLIHLCCIKSYRNSLLHILHIRRHLQLPIVSNNVINRLSSSRAPNRIDPLLLFVAERRQTNRFCDSSNVRGVQRANRVQIINYPDCAVSKRQKGNH